MQRRDHTQLMVAHILIGVVATLVLTTASSALACWIGTWLHPIWTTLVAATIVMILAIVMAWTPALRCFGLDFRDEPLEDRIVVTAAYLISVVVAPMLADAAWRSL